MNFESHNWHIYADGCMHSLRFGQEQPYLLPGGWASIIERKGMEKILYGSETIHSQDRMELMGVVNGLDFISLEEDKCDEVETIIFSDSMYVLKVLLASLTIKNRIKMFEHSILRVKNRKQYMITKAAPGHEEDGDLIYRLRQLIDKFKLQFIQVSKPLVPIQHAKCHEIASEMRWKLAIELGFAKSRHRHISERNDNI